MHVGGGHSCSGNRIVNIARHIKCMLHWVVAMGRGLAPPLLPQKIHLFTHVQEYREFMRRKGLGTLCVPSCRYIITCPWERGTTTMSRVGYHVHLQLYNSIKCKGLGFHKPLPDHDKPLELVMCYHTRMLAGLLGLGPITVSPHTPCSGCSQHQPFS